MRPGRADRAACRSVVLPWTARDPRGPAAERSGVPGTGERVGKGGDLFWLRCSLSLPEGSRESPLQVYISDQVHIPESEAFLNG